ncbi:MAG: ORF6N domain-containing protein [Prolixibacteraceae bacterium]|nr:ORF6N domain-containing protein [Prolixibacteraceae bacterium]MBN2648915.1 ORF6N domain-containing protein [Prolixibacteraceae bacterium]
MDLVKNNIENKIHIVRGVQVMLDSDLAELYNTETKFINRAVKRNPNRFPAEFMFQLTEQEWQDLKFQSGTSSEGHGGRRFLPNVFTEQGIAMLSAVLHTDIAINVSIQIMKAFISMRKSLAQLHGLLSRMEGIELKQHNTDKKIEQIFEVLNKDLAPKQGVFFEGQLFDAHVFVINLIKTAKTSILLIDNYVDENTLLMLTKRNKDVQCQVLTRISDSLKKDLLKHNKQYPPIDLIENKGFHDRFLILDNEQLFHFGASLKDVGKKCFAFSRMDNLLAEIKNQHFKIHRT